MRLSAVRSSLSLGALALAGALALGPAAAADSHPGALEHDGPSAPAQSEPSHPPNAGGAGDDALHHPRWIDGKGDRGSPATGEASGAGAPPSGIGAGTLNDIDASISVQPRRHLGGKQDKRDKLFVGKPNAASSGRADFSARLHGWRRATDGVARNAIGVGVPRDGARRHEGRRNFAAFLRAVAPVAPGNRADNRWAKTDDRLAHPANGNALIKPAVVNRGAINGSTFTHAGLGPSRIGGRGTVVVGINGSTIRPKH